MVRCPRCGYETVIDGAVAGLVGRVLSWFKRRQTAA